MAGYNPYGTPYEPGPTMVGSSVVSGQSAGTNIPGGYKSEVSYQGPVVNPQNLWAMNAMLARRRPMAAPGPAAAPAPKVESTPEVQGDAVLNRLQPQGRVQKWISYAPDGVTPMGEYVGLRRNAKDTPAGMVSIQEAQALNALLPNNSMQMVGESAVANNMATKQKEDESEAWRKKISPASFENTPTIRQPAHAENGPQSGGVVRNL